MAWSDAARAAAAEMRRARAKSKPGPRKLTSQLNLARERLGQSLNKHDFGNGPAQAMRNANRYSRFISKAQTAKKAAAAADKARKFAEKYGSTDIDMRGANAYKYMGRKK